MFVIRRTSKAKHVARHVSEMDGAASEGLLSLSHEVVYCSSSFGQTLELEWNVVSSNPLIDWVGLFDYDSPAIPFLDHRGVKDSVNKGVLSWTLSSQIIGDTKRLFFGYVDGMTGLMLLRSPCLEVTNKADLVIQEIACDNKLTAVLTINCGGKTEKIRMVNGSIVGIREIRFPIRENDTLEVACGNLRSSISVSEIHCLTSDLNISLPVSGKSDFIVQLSVAIVPIRQEFDNIDSAAMLSSMSASTSGSSMHSSSSASSSNHAQFPRSNKLSRSNLNALPFGWDLAYDKKGRPFYINHVLKKTTWQRPQADHTREIMDNQLNGLINQQNLMNEEFKRYSMARRFVDDKVPVVTSATVHAFLQRNDFITLIHENQKAQFIYNSSSILKHILHRIRSGGESIEKFEKNKDFVSFINAFADPSSPLPQGWTSVQSNPVVFVNHTNRTTTLIDPRIPRVARTERAQPRGRSAPPVRRRFDKNGNLLDIVSRTDEIALLAGKRLSVATADRIRKKLRLIEKIGHTAVIALANDLDLTMAISMLDTAEQPISSELQRKINRFYTCLHRSGYGKGPHKVRLRFSRSRLLQDAFDQILAANPETLKRARLSIIFDDEIGLDYGGPSRELFYLLSRELFNPLYGLFEYSADNQYTVQISTMSRFVNNEQQWFLLCGRVLGLALLHRCLIDTFFTHIFYHCILEQPITLEVIRHVDEEFYNSMIWLKENKVTAELGLTFTVIDKSSGTLDEKELLPGGKNLVVTDENKADFIDLSVKWKTEQSTSSRMKTIIRGLHEGGYFESHVLIEWFWDVVEEMTNAERLKLLQFVTGAASIPFEGFSALRGSNGPKKFTIEKWGDEDYLPRAHTCFNRLDLPSYPTKQILRKKLHMAITEGINYSIE
ncbi:hypothetical protein WR25_07992 [Diploscapter pachys]|uniref:HECT-type E3 ubiquitin transferase n=1 Tax=Diploscapter pachys TaxID=2018661 RepID=A0A2A2LNX0_9BILA|nr:hypothetical protein WR25_07992 [Diploscapter pachys]